MLLRTGVVPVACPKFRSCASEWQRSGQRDGRRVSGCSAPAAAHDTPTTKHRLSYVLHVCSRDFGSLSHGLGG